MKRLPFRIPEFAPRTIWTSPFAREVWEPRLRRLSQIWDDVERELVVQNVRPSALQNVTPEQLPTLMKELAPYGVIVLPLTQVPRASGYQSASRPFREGEPFDYRVAVTRPEHADAWVTAWAKGDDETIGRLLGYPGCCREFFQKVWVGEKWMDTTWRSAEGTPEGQRLESPKVTGISIPADANVNLLWRWHGIRLVSHLPHSFNCEESKLISEATLLVMTAMWPEEASWMREILSWPVEWSALHGIAEIRTPISRTSAATDATAGKLVVRYKGLGYPAEGASGTGFPHVQEKPKLPEKPKVISILRTSSPSDNGFSSREAMNEAHSKLLAFAKGPYRTVVDLGAGDGLLLSKIPATRRVGVEIDPRVAKLAEKRITLSVVGDVTDHAFVAQLLAREKPDLVIAQRDRNPLSTLVGYTVLSYSYESGADAPQLVIVDG